ncbi:hypothetical protein BSL78_12388 [Apostichopus japonicus]|uniref:Uncharacterized protein n=1 Tax=Stichopus japonicus TaxID=307972 RepID=A0A2G8KRW0_STIJA|nr:hypothetical protein BSL78_12388 [Apostichopus japonicus]
MTECDDSKSPTTPLRNRTPAKRDTNDRPDSPTDEDLPTEHNQSPSEVDKPSTRAHEGAVNHRGHADGSESPTDGHLPTSKLKPLVGLQSQMRNLTVQSYDIQVIILSKNNDAMAFYRLQALESYKLHLDQNSWELCFNKDGNIQRIHLSNIKDYKLNSQEKTFKLGVWAGNVKQNQEIILSVSSSIESLINQLKGIGHHVEKETDGSSHQKSAMKTRPVSCESNFGRSQGQNHMAHSQSYPDNLQNP